MSSPDNVLLHLAPEDDATVRQLFDELEARGFPKQNQTPHITVTFSPTMAPQVVVRAAMLLPPLVPATFQRMGTIVFGTKRKQTVAWLLQTTEELEAAARELNSINPGGRGGRWIPHLTMGLRLPREIIPDYIRALDELVSPHFKEMTATRAALWRPASQELTVLAGTHSKAPRSSSQMS